MIFILIQQRLKNIRDDRDISQQAIADYLQIDRKTYCRYENGHHEIKIDILMKLAKYYNISLDYLTGLTDIEKSLDEKPIVLKNRNIVLRQVGDEIRIVVQK